MSNPEASHPYAFFVGIDWADRKHDIYVIDAQGKGTYAQIEHTMDSIDAWITSLQTKAEGKPIAILLEQSKGALIHALMFRENVVLFPINPSKVKSYRSSFYSTPAKSDKVDAKLIARMLFERHRILKAWEPDDDLTRLLNMLVTTRRDWVDRRTSTNQQLLALLKSYYPVLAEEWTSRLYRSSLLLEIVKRYADPRKLQKQKPQHLRLLFARHGKCNRQSQDELLEKLKQKQLQISDPVLLEVSAVKAVALVKELEIQNKTIKELDSKICSAMADHPDAELFSNLKGVATTTAARLLTVFGSKRDRFQSSDEVAAHAGIAPVTSQSGKSKTVTRRFACSKFLLQTFHEFAASASKYCPWSRAFYQYHKERNMKRNAILRKLAFKWIRILYRVWQDRTSYDEAFYIEQLRRNNPQVAALIQD